MTTGKWQMTIIIEVSEKPAPMNIGDHGLSLAVIWDLFVS